MPCPYWCSASFRYRFRGGAEPAPTDGAYARSHCHTRERLRFGSRVLHWAVADLMYHCLDSIPLASGVSDLLLLHACSCRDARPSHGFTVISRNPGVTAAFVQRLRIAQPTAL
jgi:hypothetical protein